MIFPMSALSSAKLIMIFIVLALFSHANALTLDKLVPLVSRRHFCLFAGSSGGNDDDGSSSKSYLDDTNWWKNLVTNEQIGETYYYPQEERKTASIEYFFPEASEAERRINYNIPPEMLGDTRIQKAIVQDLLVADYIDTPTSKQQQQRRRLTPLTRTATNNLMEASFVGVGTVQIASSKDNDDHNHLCLFVAPSATTFSAGRATSSSTSAQQQVVAVPLSSVRSKRFIPLLTVTYQNKPISQAKCLSLNTVLVNNDDGIFDNIPWKTWSVRSGRKDRDLDAAGNVVNLKYRFGKRDAYERFLGKDWPGSVRNFSIGNMAALLLNYNNKLNQKNEKNADSSNLDATSNSNTFDEQARQILLQRILELELEEAKSKLAGAEQELALHLNHINNNSGLSAGTISSKEEDECLVLLLNLESRVAQCKKRLQECQVASNSVQLLQNQQQQNQGSNTVLTKQIITNVLQNIVDRSTVTVDNKNNTASYRGAYGYAPMIDDGMKQQQPYKGPFDILIELITKQLRSKIIGIALENISYSATSEGVIQLGGFCVIQRQPPPKGSKGQVKIGMETVDVPVQDEEDSTNEEVKTGDVYVVECDAEEAVALSIVSGIPVSIEKPLWESLNVPASVVFQQVEEAKSTMNDLLPRIKIKKNVFPSPLPSRRVESRQSSDSSNETSRSSSSGIPQTTSSLFSVASSSPSNKPPSSSNTDILKKIPSLDVYDSLTNVEKAKILLRSDSDEGKKLPRPRVVIRQKTSQETLSPLDRLLIPLVDEAVRREYLIREARRRNDYEALDWLTKSSSKRQIAKSFAKLARSEGKSDVAEMWEEEANLLKSLRADATQDEGSYSSFLDKDEWYERQRLAMVARIKKSNFGTLLDGIE